MKIEIRVARVVRYIGSSTSATSTILPSAGAITYCGPRGPVRTGSRKNTSSQTATSSSTVSGSHSHVEPRAAQAAPSTASAQPGTMNGQPSGASLTAPPHAHCGLRIVDCGFDARPSNPQSAIANPQSSVGRSDGSCALQALASDPSVGLQVPLARLPHHVGGQRRRRRVAVPASLLLQAREVVAQRLLVEARLAAPRLVAVRRPEARRVGREDLVDDEQAPVGGPLPA